MQNQEMSSDIILNSLPRAVFVLEERKIVFVNSAVQDIFGWKPKELLGKQAEVLYRSKADYEQFGQRIYSQLAKKKSYNEIFPCKNKDGREMICNVDISRIGSRLESKRVVVIYEDITERIKIEKELQESDEQYRSFIENSHEIIQNMSLDGHFLSVNPAWQKTFEYDEKDLKTLNLFEIVKEEYRGRLEEVIEKAISGKPALNEELHFTTKNKHDVILVGNIIPKTFYGKVTNIRCFFSDLTDSRRVQHEIDEKIDELERFNNIMIGRELKMIELKNKVKELQEKLNHQT